MKNYETEVECPFCERKYSAYLMYKHMAVSHCDKIEDFIKLLEQLKTNQQTEPDVIPVKKEVFNKYLDIIFFLKKCQKNKWEIDTKDIKHIIKGNFNYVIKQNE